MIAQNLIPFLEAHVLDVLYKFSKNYLLVAVNMKINPIIPNAN